MGRNIKSFGASVLVLVLSLMSVLVSMAMSVVFENILFLELLLMCFYGHFKVVTALSVPDGNIKRNALKSKYH